MLKNDINIMIEDKVENINNISKIMPVICFNASYNKSCKGNNIFRAYTWYDVYYQIINVIDDKKQLRINLVLNLGDALSQYK